LKNTLVAITMGDPAGIGPEIVVKAVKRGFKNKYCNAIVVGDASIINATIRTLNLELNVIPINEVDKIALSVPKPKGSSIYLVDVGIIKNVESLKIGEISKIGGEASYRYIQKSIELAKDKLVDAVVTAPINKESIKLFGVKEAGHTEIFGKLTGSNKVVTMFSVDNLRIFFHTRHISLKKAIERLSVASVFKSIMLSYKSMCSIGYKSPKLALAALNPHASDGGLFGDEEKKILNPACKMAKNSGIDIIGPVPADSVFHQCLEGKFDAVISLYHDQGHVAAKTYDFYRTVSVTLGLPFIRTSVDHGTAFDIAWKGIANPVSMNCAMDMACELARKYKPLV